jgi:hypothetical protein
MTLEDNMSEAQVGSNKKEIELSEANVNIRTFRKLADVENFYRFIFDNNLRAEARIMIESLYTHLGGKKTKRKRRKKSVQ